MPTNHRLFKVAYWFIKAAIFLTAFTTALLLLTLGGVLVVGMHFSAAQLGMPAGFNGVDRFKLLSIAAFVLTCCIACAVLVFFALRATAEIIKAATFGDPFVDENAKRLMRIGWLLLAVEIVGFFAHPIFNYMATHLISENLIRQANLRFDDFGFDGRMNFHLSIFSGQNMSPVGLLAVLLIFVLAQIFRRGSEMRAELQETV